MTRSYRTHLRIVALVCVVVLGLFAPTGAPVVNSSSNSNPSGHSLVNVASEKKGKAANMFAFLEPTKGLANLSPAQETFDICLQDDSSRDTLQINSATGAYKYTRCSDGRILTGTGALTTHGCAVTLQDFVGIRRVLARVDTCVHSGTASIKVTATVEILNVTITDRNTANNTCDCSAPPPPPPVLPDKNITVGQPSILQDSQSVAVFVPLTISSLRGAAIVEAEFTLFLVTDQGIATRVAGGTISTAPTANALDSCGPAAGGAEGCTGACADRTVVTETADLSCDLCFLGTKKTVKRVPAQCQTFIGPFGGRCGCGAVVLIEFDLIPRSTIGTNTSLLFIVDPNGQVAEFNENDNQIVVPIPPPCRPTPP